MATIINNPGSTDEGSGLGAGLILGIVLAIIIAVFLLFYFVPALRAGFGGNNGNDNPQVNVPGQIDVNVNKGTGY